MYSFQSREPTCWINRGDASVVALGIYPLLLFLHYMYVSGRRRRSDNKLGTIAFKTEKHAHVAPADPPSLGSYIKDVRTGRRRGVAQKQT